MTPITRRELLAVLTALGLTSCGHSGQSALLPPTSGKRFRAQPAALSPSYTVVAILADENNALYVVTQSGDLWWYQDTGTTAAGTPSSHAVQFANGGSGQKIASGWQSYTQFAYGGNGVIYAADASGNVFWYQDRARNGSINWARASGKQIGSALSISRMAGGASGVLYVVNSAGQLLWYGERRKGNGTALNGGRVLASGWNAYGPVFSGGNGVLYAVSGNQILWFQDLAQNGNVNFASGSGTAVHGAQAAGAMYASNLNGNVYAVLSNGQFFRAKDLSRSASASWDVIAWQEIGIGWDAYPVVNGYTVPASVTTGQSIAFKLSGGRGSTSTQLSIYRLHLNGVAGGNNDFGTLMAGPTTVPVTWQGVPAQPWSDDHLWQTSFTQTIPSNWPTGLYAAFSQDPSGAWRFIPFVVRSTTVQNPVAVLSYTNTWNAYNDYGGLSQYTNPNGTPLTFNRPNPSLTPLGSNINWTLRAETLCLSFLENAGIAYDLYTDLELHLGTLNLSSYSVLVLASHPEYFSMEMRTALVNYLAGGGTIVYLGANGIYERVIYGTGNTSLQFRQNVSSLPPPPRWLFADQGYSESEILGVRYSGTAQSNAAPYSVVNAAHPFFAGTGVSNGQLIGSSGINGNGSSGYEWDVISSASGSPANTQLLALGQNPGGGANMAYYQTPAGGFVFSVSSLCFSGSLAVDPVLQQVVKNALAAAVGPRPTPSSGPSISIVQKTFASANSTSVTATLANVPKTGNVLLFVLTAYGSATVPTPAGWTLIDSKISGQAQMYRYWRAVQSGDGRSWTVSGVSATQYCTLSVLEINGASTASPVPPGGNAIAAQSTSATWTACPSLQPAVLNCLPLIMAGEGATNQPPASYSPSTWSAVQFASVGEECAIAAGPITADTVTPISCNPTWNTAVGGLIGILLIQPNS